MSEISKRTGDLIKERRKRKGWSQTVLGDFVGMSAATVHRIEHGEKIPTDDEAKMIAGFLAIEHEQLLQACATDRESRKSQTKQPLLPPVSAYQTIWDTAHPAMYAGRVWIQITPHPDSRHLPHEFTLKWGVWQRTGTIQFSANQASIYLEHYKHNDGQGLPLFLTLSQQCYVVFGKGHPPENAPSIDINSQWQRTEPIPPKQLRRFIGHYIGWYVGRLFGQR